MDVLVDKDWCSTGLWVRGRTSAWANAPYSIFELPNWLLERFEYWSNWFDQCTPEHLNDRPDWKAFCAYELSLAIDLKRVLGDTVHVFLRTEGEISEIFCNAKEPRK
jgi:hypothetical protein